MAQKKKQQTEQPMVEHTFSHCYIARVTHEVTYQVPARLKSESAILNYIFKNCINPISTEAVDEDFLEDVDDNAWEMIK